MKIAKAIIYTVIACTMAGCTITGRINRRAAKAVIEHTPRQIREHFEQKHEETYKRGYIEYTRVDSTKEYLIPTVTGPDGETMMTLTIPEVIVTATSRSIPERNGKVNIDFVVTLPKELMGNCRGVDVTPMLHKAEESVPLQDLTIRGGLFSKVQQRNYWQYDRYLDVFKPDEVGRAWAYERFIYYPYPEGTRLDSVVTAKSTISYYYTQEVNTTEASNRLLITLMGKVVALDHSDYAFPLSDTLEYNISSMLSFTDTTTRYMTKVIEKYAVVNDRNYLHFALSKSDINDTLRDNGAQLERIQTVMDEILNQKEFHVDSIILTAMASPDGALKTNDRMSRARAHSLRDYLASRFRGKGLDSLVSVRWIGEDWEELQRLLADGSPMKNHNRIYNMVCERHGKDLDEIDNRIRREYPDDYKYLLAEVYPRLRALNIKYDLRRVGMVKDTIHTTVVDTLYARGVRLMKERQYHDALSILHGFFDRNAAICLMSLGHDERAREMLRNLPENAEHCYLLAVVSARLGRKDEALEYFGRAVELHDPYRYRGKLDPEISELIKDSDYGTD